jgi:hypothetical protein
MLVYASNFNKITILNPEINEKSFSNLEKLINYKIDIFPPCQLVKSVVDRREKIDKIRNDSLEIECVNSDINTIQVNNGLISLYVLLKCLFNC